MEKPIFKKLCSPRCVVCVVLLGIGGLFGVWLTQTNTGLQNQSSDSHSSFGNIRKEEQIVGSTKCGECHIEQLRSYLQSGHARTFWLTRGFPFRDRFKDLKFEDLERGNTFRYFLEESGLEVTLPEVFGERRFPLQYAFGSGEHAVTFMTLISSRLGTSTGVEHRVSWFTSLKAAGPTPGQRGLVVRQDVEHFGRTHQGNALQKCFECHTTSFTIRGDQLVNLNGNVGCESCHSNGASHVAAMEMEEAPAEPLFGFGQSPWRTKEQISLCGNCHRSVDVVSKSQITRKNRKIVRYQPVGLVQSKCYTQSRGQLLCSTCHDPHEHATKRTTAEYEQICLQCHSAATPHVIQCPVSPKNGCISCHMPPVEVHPPIAFHDHWIRVREETNPGSAPLLKPIR